ncbi:MAG: hypothetical protein WB791_02370, partial [Waddliaceae bacterium]
FVGLDLAYTDKQVYPKNVIPHPLDDESIKVQISRLPHERIVPITSDEGEKILTRVDWLEEARQYGEWAEKHPHTRFLNATEGGIPIPKIPRKRFQDVADEELTRVIDLDNWVHAQIQTSGHMPVKEEEVVKNFKKWEAILRESKEAFRQFIEQLNTATAEELPAREKRLEEQINQMTFLRQMNRMLSYLMFRETYFLDNYPEIFTQEEMNRTRFRIALTRAVFLRELVKWQLSSMQDARSRYKERIRLDELPEIAPQSQESAAEGEFYSFDGNVLVIIDPELLLSYRASFFPPEEQRHVVNYPNGAIRREWYTLDGSIHGPSVFYSEEGKLLAKGWFLHGQRQGKNRQFFPSGNLYSLQRFRDGVRHGRQDYFYEDQTKKTILHYCQGKLHGLVQLYHRNGRLKREIPFLNGRLHGKERMRDAAGQLILEAEYADNQPKGTARSWYSGGERKQKVIYYDSPDHFDRYRWDKEGRLLEKNVYFPERISKEAVEKSQEMREGIERLKSTIEELKKRKKNDKD